MKFFHFLHPPSSSSSLSSSCSFSSSSSSSSSSKSSNKGKHRLASLFLKSSNTSSSSQFASQASNSSNIDWKHALRFERNKELEQAFMVLDADGDGYISLEELKAWLRSFFSIIRSNKAKEPSDEELAFMVAEVDKDADGFLSFQDFREFLFTSSFSSSSSSSSSSSCDEDEDAWFHAVDLNNDGLISCEELHEVMVQSVGIKSCTVHECRLMISSHDSDGDGFLNAQDFRKLLLS